MFSADACLATKKHTHHPSDHFHSEREIPKVSTNIILARASVKLDSEETESTA